MHALKRVLNKLMFSSVSSLLRKGAERPLDVADMPDLPSHLGPRASLISPDAVIWTNGTRLLTSLQWALLRYWGPQLGFYLIFAVMNLMGPILVNQFVSRLSSGWSNEHELWMTLTLGVAVGLVGLVGGLSLQHYFYHHLARHQIVTNILNTKIFTHALQLTKNAREKTAIGDIVNHMSSDSDSVAEVANAIADILYCVVMIFGAVGLLFYYLGTTAWVAVGLLSVLAPVTRWVGRTFTRYDEELMKWRDKRVTAMSQILSAIRLVKYFVWEKSVSAQVEEVRSKEIGSRWRLARAELVVTLLYVSVGTFVLFAVLAVHVSRGRELSAALVFTCVSLFGLLEDPFAFISRSISQLISGKVGADRIAKFLSQPIRQSAASDGKMRGPLSLAFQSVTVRHEDTLRPALKDVSMFVPAGSAVAIVGAVGSGKSTFINALLGEVPTKAGAVQFTDREGCEVLDPRIGYVPQEAYILNGTLRDNITFGFDAVTEAEVSRALQVTTLSSDINLIPGGLAAEIGEKGINLSGGQRQRLSLARAMVHKPGLVVLDDPLSALDPATEGRIVQDLIMGEWSEVTRLMVTHRLSHLHRFDWIAFLEHGELVGFGSYKDLIAKCAPFREYIEEYGRHHAESEKSTAQHEMASSEPLRMTEEEDREYGAVKGQIYLDYVRRLGGSSAPSWTIFLLALAAGSNTLLPLVQKAWLAYATGHQGKVAPLTSIYVYGALGLIVLGGTLAGDLFWLRRGLAAGRDLHDRMFSSILKAPIRFFDSTPVGRVLQRFSRDMEAVDIHLQWCFEHSMKCFAQVVITLFMIVVALPLVILPLAPVLYFYYRIQKFYRVSAREAKRLDSIARSPRYAHFKETLSGLQVIRAFGRKEWFMNEFYRRLEHSQKMFRAHYLINRWFSARIPVIGGLVAIVTTLMVVWSVHMQTLSPGFAGLITVYSLSFWGVLNWGIRIWSEVEARMTSLERIQYYSQIPPEEDSARDGEVRASWPEKGEVCFENVSAKYAEHLPKVLDGLSFKVAAGQKAGLIGRTGSGKSTVFQTLYRFVNVTEGRITVDGVDIRSVPLARLRRALAIIPQDPTLFMGSLRSNLDRDKEFTDAAIFQILDQVELGHFVRSLPAGLKTELAENGLNFSQGQRQLVCLARAFLLNAKVIILDEATASVDVKTDATVQRVLRELAGNVTMIVIAHRLGTLRDCDQVIELRGGKVVESLSLTASRSNTTLEVGF